MRLGGVGTLAAMALAALAGAACLYIAPSLRGPVPVSQPSIEARQPGVAADEPRTVALSMVGGGSFAPVAPVAAGVRGDSLGRPQPPAPEASRPALAALPNEQEGAAKAATDPDDDDDGDVTPTLEGKSSRPPGKRSFTILHIGDSHTSADFLTGELRRRLQARYGRGAPGYITAGHPHIGVRTSSLKITASAGWTYKSLQRPDAVSAEFWLSGYNAVATAAGETMTFASERPATFDTIEIEVLRQPGGGAIEVRLDGVVETSYELKAAKLEPVVIRLQPARAATEKVREISITTKGQGTVSLASVAIYNRQSGLTYNSVGYVGAQVSLINKFNSKLFANDLIRINPHIVVLAFGTNEAFKESLDVAEYAKSYERVVTKIKSILPRAAIVVISPPDHAELPAQCRKDKAGQGSCGREAKSANAANGTANGAAGGSDCIWRTPAKLNQIREVQRDIAKRHDLAYWNWASIMPRECGPHQWYTASPPLMAKDHVHFTIEGYKKSAEQFLNTLIPVIEKVRVGAYAVPNN